MIAVTQRLDAHSVPALQPTPQTRARLAAGQLAPAIEAAIWRGQQLGSSLCPSFGSSVSLTLNSGFTALDAQLPGGGWPCHALTEVLQAQPSVAEWRLLAPAMSHVMSKGKDVVLVGPPKTPHLPGLRQMGLDERKIVWIQADTPAERLWATEQLVKANAAGVLLAWLPQARQEQIRRLQVCAQSCEGAVFLCRPLAAQYESSAAPLRLELRFGVDWELRVQLLKRKGAAHDDAITLASVPGGLQAILTPRLKKPSLLIATHHLHVNPPETNHVVGSLAPRPSLRPALRSSLQRAAAH